MVCILDLQTPLPQDMFVPIQTCDNPNQYRPILYVAGVDLGLLNFDFGSCKWNSPDFSKSPELNYFQGLCAEASESTIVLDHNPLK